MAETTVARQAEEGKALWVLGGLYEVKASGAETDGKLTVMQMTIPAGMGPPPHVHPGGEAVYVIEGRIRYHIGDDEIEGGPGSFFYVPEGVWENFEPVEDVRLLVIYAPSAEIDEFFDEVGDPAEQREVPPPSDEPPDVERIMAAAERHGMQIQAPAEA